MWDTIWGSFICRNKDGKWETCSTSLERSKPDLNRPWNILLTQDTCSILKIYRIRLNATPLLNGTSPHSKPNTNPVKNGFWQNRTPAWIEPHLSGQKQKFQTFYFLILSLLERTLIFFSTKLCCNITENVYKGLT